MAVAAAGAAAGGGKMAALEGVLGGMNQAGNDGNNAANSAMEERTAMVDKVSKDFDNDVNEVISETSTTAAA